MMTVPPQPDLTPPRHTPVLRDRVVELLTAAPDGVVVDGTLGAGGHAAAVTAARLARHGRARLVGIDRDPHALELAGERLSELAGHRDVRIDLVGARFDELPDVLDRLAIGEVAGVLLDLGISSMHVDDASRGFSYRLDGPLDMRMDPASEMTADDLVNGLDREELVAVLTTFGEERFARRIADAIVAHRPLSGTVELAAVVRDAVPHAARRTGPHPATRTFQALRIAVNAEIDALDNVLGVVVDRLAVGGVAVVLSYHSLEDRPVKRAFAEAARGCVCPPDLPVCACGRSPRVEHLVRRPERASQQEVADNPRSASVRLRAVRRLPVPDDGPAAPGGASGPVRPRQEAP